MGSTFGYSSASEKKARLSVWKGKDPIKVSNGHCSTTAKSVGDSSISEEGRQLLATNLQRLLDAEKTKSDYYARFWPHREIVSATVHLLNGQLSSFARLRRSLMLAVRVDMRNTKPSAVERCKQT
jgi:hypothetical protein